MKINEAIKILQSECCVPNSIFMTDKYQAIALGIEALKCVKDIRNYPFPDSILHLPGEET